MAVSKVIVASVFIGILVRQVSSQPTKRKCDCMPESSIIYHLPKTLQADDTIDIKIKANDDLKSFSISLMTGDNKTAFTLLIKSDNHQNLPRHLSHLKGSSNGPHIIEESLASFLEDSIINVPFTVRRNENSSQTNILEITPGDPREILEETEIEEIKYLKIVGEKIKVLELKFTFS